MKASEMLAARKAAKKEQAVKKYARDNIGNQRADRNKLANIAVIQVQNKLSLRSGAPQDLDSKLTENIKNLMHYQALVYENDRSSITVFEKLIRAMRVVACIYSDNDLSKTTNEAQAAIEQLSESADLSPNQRREILKPVLVLPNIRKPTAKLSQNAQCQKSACIAPAYKSHCTQRAYTIAKNATFRRYSTSSTANRYEPSPRRQTKKKTFCAKRY